MLCALLWLFRKRQIEAACKDIVASKGLLAVSGEISFIIGLAIAIDHPIWEYNWKGLITLIGYLLILKRNPPFCVPQSREKMGLQDDERNGVLADDYHHASDRDLPNLLWI